MLKITDKEYELWDYIPMEILEELSSGKSRPLLMRCICKQNQSRDEIVVKLSDNVMSDDAKCREIIASFIANELGMLVAEPVLVHINDDVVLAFKGTQNFERLRQAQGKNFGNKWAGEGYNEFIKGFTLKKDIFLKALQVFIFDVLIVNADRRFEKQNLKTYQDDIIIFDHESAFGFVFEIFPKSEPWLFEDYDIKWIKKHLFYPEIKKNYEKFDVSRNIDNFMNVLLKIDSQFWQKAKKLIPLEWQQSHNQVSKIETRFELINQNIHKFANSIKQLFS